MGFDGAARGMADELQAETLKKLTNLKSYYSADIGSQLSTSSASGAVNLNRAGAYRITLQPGKYFVMLNMTMTADNIGPTTSVKPMLRGSVTANKYVTDAATDVAGYPNKRLLVDGLTGFEICAILNVTATDTYAVGAYMEDHGGGNISYTFNDVCLMKLDNPSDLTQAKKTYFDSVRGYGYVEIYSESTFELKKDWVGKSWVSYGDSITAIGNGDGLTLGWQSYVNNYHKFGIFRGRGIGGQSFVWNSKVWFANADGTYHSRDDNGDAGNPASYTLPSGKTAHYGAFCSWDRITKMIPSSIKDTIDLIFIMGGTNDTYNAGESTTISFIASSTTDAAWAASPSYATYGGDYDLTTFRGAIASTIMKFQAWCPNAVIVMGTPLSGRGSTGVIGTSLSGTEYEKAGVIKEVCGKFSIPVIDVFSICGINPLNRTTYITDSVHPYNDAGKKMLARAVLSGLKNVSPNI